MKQIREETNNDESLIKKKILEIVNKRGKMHNPITNSGGVMLGTVLELGSKRKDVSKNDLVIPLASISCFPLYISKIISISDDTVQVEGIFFNFIFYKK